MVRTVKEYHVVKVFLFPDDLTNSDMLIARVDQPFINFITNTQDFVFLYKLCNHFYFFSFIHLNKSIVLHGFGKMQT